MDDGRVLQSAPAWFTPAAIAALLWQMVGCALYILNAFADPASLPVDQRALAAATPSWMFALWSFAVLTGLAGAVLLLMRHRRAEPLLLVSLLALAAHLAGLVLVPGLRNLIASDDLLLPTAVAVVGYAIWHLARLAKRSGWLR